MEFNGKLKSGQYWIGDPCYLFPDSGHLGSKWEELLEKTKYFNTEMPFELDGKIKAWVNRTGIGCGVYVSNTNHSFLVESEFLGIIPLDTILYLGAEDFEHFGLMVTFDSDFDVKISNGEFYKDLDEKTTKSLAS